MHRTASAAIGGNARRIGLDDAVVCIHCDRTARAAFSVSAYYAGLQYIMGADTDVAAAGAVGAERAGVYRQTGFETDHATRPGTDAVGFHHAGVVDDAVKYGVTPAGGK